MRNKILLLIIIMPLLFAGCGGDDNGNDDIKYTVALDCPATISNGESHDVTVSISPTGDNISSVDLFLNGKSHERKFTSPFVFSLTLKDINTGEYSLQATVTLGDGTVLNSEEKKFTFIVSEGDYYQGGVVIKVTDDGLHGIIAATADLTGGVSGTYRYGSEYVDYGAYSMDDGRANTDKFKDSSDNDYAAVACLNLTVEGYSDWYLPAVNELELFLDHLEKLNIPERIGNRYWSSTGSSTDLTVAYTCRFGTSIVGTSLYNVRQYFYVRPCRQF